MPMTTRMWLEKAKKEQFAIGAFNVGNLETLKAIAQAARSQRSPIIIESSPGETEWMGANNIVDLAKNYAQELAIPILINLDHAQSKEECLMGIEAGYDLIHFDGSKLPFEQNLNITKQVGQLAHQRGLVVEGEIDHIQGSSQVHPGSAAKEAAKGKKTDPKQAALFVRKSGVDIFAAFFGNVHGIFLEKDENLDFDLLQGISDALPDTFLSLHGGSGIADDQVRRAIVKGIVKVNVNTEMRQAFKETLQQRLAQNPNEYALYKLEPPVIEAVQKIVEHKILVFGSAGKAGK